ncbi:hypothetical protein [Rheinheimera soli]|uniref:hypothetical protein n=1 Tax=Rheinheimera soli TaxID=443616 RepID=UPI001E2A85F2|nr:hypothetical protein [Rheinheimera soli]
MRLKKTAALYQTELVLTAENDYKCDESPSQASGNKKAAQIISPAPLFIVLN